MAKKINIPRDVLFQKYEIEKKSGPDIAKEMNISEATIYRFLEKYKITIRNQSESHRINIDKKYLYQKYIVEKKSTDDIGKELNTNHSTIWNYLRRYNIPVRNYKEAFKLSKKLNGFAKMKEENPEKLKRIIKGIIERRKENKEGWSEICSRAGKESHRIRKIRGELSGFAKMKKEDPERFKKVQLKASILGAKFLKENPEIKTKISKRAVETCKKKGIGFFNKDVMKLAQIKSTETQRKKGIGVFDPEVQKLAKIGRIKFFKLHPNLLRENGIKVTKLNRKNKKGFFDPKLQKLFHSKEAHSKAGKMAHIKHPNLGKENGLKSVKILRDNKPYILDGVHFDSNEEREVAKILLNKPIDGINCQVVVDSITIDFYPQSYDKVFCGKFIEYHPWDRKLTTKEYYDWRRKVLDENGFKDKELIVIDNRNFIKQNKKK